MGSDTPKQYQRIGRCTLLEHSVRALMSDPRVARVLIVVAPADPHAAALALPSGVRLAPVGGSSRAESVRNGLRALAGEIDLDDRVLVHDAARPCLSARDLTALIDAVGLHDAGGLLAEPLSDTLKRVDGAVLWANQSVDITKPIVDLYNAQAGVPAAPSASRPSGTRPAGTTSKPAPPPAPKPQGNPPK